MVRIPMTRQLLVCDTGLGPLSKHPEFLDPVCYFPIREKANSLAHPDGFLAGQHASI